MGIPHHKTRNLSQRAHGKAAACLLRIFQLATVIACMHDLLFLGDSVAAQLGAFLKLNSKHEIKKRGKPTDYPRQTSHSNGGPSIMPKLATNGLDKLTST